MEVANVFSYRSKQEGSSDSDSEDSEKDWKRAVKSTQSVVESDTPDSVLRMGVASTACQMNESESQSFPSSRKRKANSIWCTVLEDQTMSENFKEVGLKKKPVGYEKRTCESYDYTLKYDVPVNDDISDGHMSSDDRMSDETNCSRSSHPQQSKKFKTCPRKYIKLDKDGIVAARKIIRILSEQKQYLIYRVVKIVGIEKALSLVKMTEQIEENGGMMIKNNARRRTPGGVFFQLLKSDKSITKEQVDKIFEGEYSSFEMRKIFKEQKRKKQCSSAKKAPTVVSDSMDMQTPETLNNTAVNEKRSTSPLLENIPVHSTLDLEEGEIED